MKRSSGDYVGLRQAAILAGVTTHTLLKCAAMGQIRTVARVGEYPWFHKEDAKKLANQIKVTA